MIIGLKKYNDKNTYYIQNNNAIEQILKKVRKNISLENCGPTSAVMIMAALGYDLTTYAPGGYMPQPEDILTVFLNDPRNYRDLKKCRENLDPNKYPGNRIPQYYPLATQKVFGIPSFFSWGLDEKIIEHNLSQGKGVMVQLIKPGHYVAIVAYDPDKREVTYNDPWPGNYWPVELKGTSGFNRKLDIDKFLDNCKKFRVEIG